MDRITTAVQITVRDDDRTLIELVAIDRDGEQHLISGGRLTEPGLWAATRTYADLLHWAEQGGLAAGMTIRGSSTWRANDHEHRAIVCVVSPSRAAVVNADVDEIVD